MRVKEGEGGEEEGEGRLCRTEKVRSIEEEVRDVIRYPGERTNEGESGSDRGPPLTPPPKPVSKTRHLPAEQGRTGIIAQPPGESLALPMCASSRPVLEGDWAGGGGEGP